MQIDPESLESLKRICADSFDRILTEQEAREIGQRIIRYLRNSKDGAAPALDPSSDTLTRKPGVR